MSAICEYIYPFIFSNKSEFSYALEKAIFLITYTDLTFSKGLVMPYGIKVTVKGIFRGNLWELSHNQPGIISFYLYIFIVVKNM